MDKPISGESSLKLHAAMVSTHPAPEKQFKQD
jgi:hypothetical protein